MSKRCCKGEDRFLCFRTPCSLLNQWFRLVNFAGIVNWRIWKWINDQVNLETHQPLVDLLKAKSALWAALKLFSVCRPPPFFLDTSIWGLKKFERWAGCQPKGSGNPCRFSFFWWVLDLGAATDLETSHRHFRWEKKVERRIVWTSEAFLRVSVHSRFFFSSIERDFLPWEWILRKDKTHPTMRV